MPPPEVPPAFAACIELLQALGAPRTPHGPQRSLQDHLLGTASILAAWMQPPEVCLAGAAHSIYGTDVFSPRLLGLDQRNTLRNCIGPAAERLVYLFCTVRRARLFDEVGARGRLPDEPLALGDEIVSADEAAGLLLLHMANEVEQARGPDGGPGRWLGRVLTWGRALRPGRDRVPGFVALGDPPSAESEERAGALYREAMRCIRDGTPAGQLFDEAAALCPALAEPVLWSAMLTLPHDPARARDQAAQARRLFQLWGAPWDKRMTLAAWLHAAEAIETGEAPPAQQPESPAQFPDPLEAATPARRIAREPGPEHEAPLPARLAAYLRALSQQPDSRILYPGLSAVPWHDPARFAIVAALEERFPALRREVLALPEASFHSEGESIGRQGDWAVSFLYESGRRHDETCAALPVLTGIVEQHATMRTMGGLIYISRLRSGTEIRAHCGPSNLRLRCHLAVRAPAGDCWLSVGGEERPWQEGRCLVFDDTFRHAAWNRTAEDRIVVVIDLWHPDLSADEVAFLSGLHRHVWLQASWLGRYYAGNARAREYH